jgi:hypothetical protein
VHVAMSIYLCPMHGSDHLHGRRLMCGRHHHHHRGRRRHDVDDDGSHVGVGVGPPLLLVVGLHRRLLHLRHGAVLLGVPVPVHEEENHLGQAEQQAQHVRHLHIYITHRHRILAYSACFCKDIHRQDRKTAGPWAW